ncbi:hypothetical protein [Luteibacter sp.]|uniref:hypothetical protein n=1 Tax=Luteibacter sp. TaxID=1886636 RepID=UPI00280789ED|nr:hypothetical protein [Luteibacter sp.]MDQ8050733.1 hypothetical protein [Luteibacter sp.]
MSGGAKKAAPREKGTVFGEQLYRVTDRAHYINLKLEPVGAIVRLPEGVEPGKHLVPVDEDGNEIVEKKAPEKPAEKDAGKQAAK